MFAYLKDFKLSEDAMQDTFIKVYKKYSSFTGDDSGTLFDIPDMMYYNM